MHWTHSKLFSIQYQPRTCMEHPVLLPGGSFAIMTKTVWSTLTAQIRCQDIHKPSKLWIPETSCFFNSGRIQSQLAEPCSRQRHHKTKRCFHPTGVLDSPCFPLPGRPAPNVTFRQERKDQRPGRGGLHPGVDKTLPEMQAIRLVRAGPFGAFLRASCFFVRLKES